MANLFDVDTFIIHLKTNTEREDTLEKVRELGFKKAQFSDAVIGKNLTPSLDYISPRVMLELEEGRTSHEGIVSMGAIGCYLSHTNLWKKIVNENIPVAAIFEDDIDLDDIAEKRSELQAISQKILDEDYDLLLIGLYPRCSDENDLPRITDRYIGNHSYFITLEGAKRLLKYAFPIDMHLDAYIGLIAKFDKEAKIFGYQIIDQNSRGGSTTSLDDPLDILGWATIPGCRPKSAYIFTVPKFLILVCILLLLYVIVVSLYKRFR